MQADKIPDEVMREARRLAISLNGFAISEDFERVARALMARDKRAADRIEALEAWKAEVMEVLLDAAAHLAAASSAYNKFAARHKDLKPRAVADPMFTTRNSDFIKAASRVSSAARRLVEKEDGRG